METVIAIFDIGKTNKKLMLFNDKAEPVFQHEEMFPTATDEDGIELDDIDRVELWVQESINEMVNSDKYILAGVNFSTYGASLAFVDEDGKRLAPVYNYLKPVDERYAASLFNKYGGKFEFCRQTASPALGAMLNSGVQLIWIREKHPGIMAKTKHVLHFPQYLSYLFTKRAISEYTSIGCHTFMWDFDKKNYHQWLAAEGISLPNPVPNSLTFDAKIGKKTISIGVGMHDSSASLVPYLQGCDGKFVLISTGTWCISMNPFNHSPLTADELANDCLCYMSVTQEPVKSSRFFLGHIHDVNVQRLTSYFKVEANAYKNIEVDDNKVKQLVKQGEHEKIFFKDGIPSGYIDEIVDLSRFNSFADAYYRFMLDLTTRCALSVKLVLDDSGEDTRFFISGGFARNEIFVRLMATFFPGKLVYTSRVYNASATGAALVILDKVIPGAKPGIDLGLKQWKGYN